MVEYNCQKFLNKFLEKKVLLKYNKDRKNALLITETRPSLNLILVIKNALSIFKNHNLIVVGSTWVFKLIEKFIGNEFHKININKIKISIKEYSNLLTDKDFWSKIKEENIMVIQSDCLILRDYDFENFKYGMIGPVSLSKYENSFVMNGGFSLRKKDLMMELCNKSKEINVNEDIYFSNLIRSNYPELMPSKQECNNFAIESWGNPYTAIGIHGTDKYYCSPELFIEVFKSLES